MVPPTPVKEGNEDADAVTVGMGSSGSEKTAVEDVEDAVERARRKTLAFARKSPIWKKCLGM